MSYNMLFIAVRDSLVTLLGEGQGIGIDQKWDTIGFQERDQSAKENFFMPTIQTYFNTGDFQQNKSSMVGSIQHSMKFNLILSVAEKAKGDLTALDDADTQAEYLAAQATFTRSEFETDRSMDQLISDIWLFLMNPENRDMGLDPLLYPHVGNRWIPDVRKEAVKRSGNLCTMRAIMTISGLIPEDLIGQDTTGLPEYEQPPYSGDITIKDNVPQSGNLDQGTPIVSELP